ncbi:molybdopterin molybdotransferase MoeA [Paracoccus sp. Z330]|uniref:Molybdopterin molybdenumtransferase n=1 Tax=Paracoccus onchidii TaxID=3017813 RepID=A0ABT4ZKZ2_9RHOB|nr:gephyrin-like molybdotransferase Glp [Paracoccus onchidii]MDB6179416.1 molybdopterin molybdotransferase MoeA [Paracoccus onchidii]
MISVDDALSRVLALADTPGTEIVKLSEAAGRALAAPVTARLTQPPFDAAAMDGYALRSEESAGTLRVIGQSAAGHPWNGDTPPMTAVRIFTGAPVPAGYDRVVMQENIQRSGNEITITEPSNAAHIRPRGNDFSEGDQLPAGRCLTAADIGLIAAMNVPEVTVAKRPRVAILAGGDELVPPGHTPQEGQIISSNDLAIAAQVTQAGGIPVILPIARDTESSLRSSFASAMSCDLIVTIGGASVGDHDLIAKVAAELGMQRSFYKIAMRPGKPLMAGKLSGTPMLGLPGNPVSAMVCGMIFMQPLIRAMQGLTNLTHLAKARLAATLPPEGPRQHYLRATLTDGPDLPIIQPFDSQDSARLSLMAQADALLVRPADAPAQDSGTIVEYLPLPR